MRRKSAPRFTSHSRLPLQHTHIPYMSVTLEVSHVEILLSKLVAESNLHHEQNMSYIEVYPRLCPDHTHILYIAVTLEVSHVEISPLKLVAP